MAVGRITWPPRNWETTTAQFITDHVASPSGDVSKDIKDALNSFAGTNHKDITLAYRAFIEAGGEVWSGAHAQYPTFELAPASVVFALGEPGSVNDSNCVLSTGALANSIANDTVSVEGTGDANPIVCVAIAMTTGKWYVEFEIVGVNGTGGATHQLGVSGNTLTVGPHAVATDSADAIGNEGSGRIKTGNVVQATDLAADIDAEGLRFACAFDADARTYWAGEIRSAPTIDWIGNDTASAGYPSGGLAASGNTSYRFGVSIQGFGFDSGDPYKVTVVQEADIEGAVPSGFTYLGS